MDLADLDLSMAHNHWPGCQLHSLKTQSLVTSFLWYGPCGASLTSCGHCPNRLLSLYKRSRNVTTREVRQLCYISIKKTRCICYRLTCSSKRSCAYPKAFGIQFDFYAFISAASTGNFIFDFPKNIPWVPYILIS